MEMKVRDLPDNYEQRKKELDSIRIEDNSMKLIEVCQKLMSYRE